MNHFRTLSACLLLSLAITGCNEGEEDVVASKKRGGASAPAGAVGAPGAASGGLRPYEVAANAISVGTTLNGNTVVRAARPSFTTADTVYAGASVGRFPSGSKARVYWTYQNGRTDKEEVKVLAGEETIWFAFTGAEGMKPGRYNVQIDVNMRPLGIVDFEVR